MFYRYIDEEFPQNYSIVAICGENALVKLTFRIKTAFPVATTLDL